MKRELVNLFRDAEEDRDRLANDADWKTTSTAVDGLEAGDDNEFKREVMYALYPRLWWCHRENHRHWCWRINALIDVGVCRNAHRRLDPRVAGHNLRGCRCLSQGLDGFQESVSATQSLLLGLLNLFQSSHLSQVSGAFRWCGLEGLLDRDGDFGRGCRGFRLTSLGWALCCLWETVSCRWLWWWWWWYNCVRDYLEQHHKKERECRLQSQWKSSTEDE